jgi:O-antigen ligase
VQLGCVLVAWAVWYSDLSAGWWALVAVAPLFLRVLTARPVLWRTPLDLGLAAFMLTALVGVWAAYDRSGSQAVWPGLTPVGWQVLWGLVLAGSLFYALIGIRSEVGQRWLMALCACLGAAGAVWFAAAQDWVQEPAKLAAITRLGRAVQVVLPHLPGAWLNTNIVAGVLAVLLPSSLGLALGDMSSGRRSRWAWRGAGWASAALIGFGLLLSTSRGAWSAVAVGMALAAVWRLAGRRVRGRRQLLDAGGAVALLLAVGVLAIVLSPELRAWAWGYAAAVDRTEIYREALLLVRDYPITGLGLGEFAVQHSTYALLIHVPVLPYAHSFYLDVALGQGLGGLLVALSLLGGALVLGLWALGQAQRPSPVLGVGLLSLVVMLVHGLVDDPLYINRALPLLWMPAGFVVVGTRNVQPRLQVAVRAGAGWGLAAVGVSLAVGCALWPPLRALWFANLGAVRQAKIELSAYDYKRYNNPSLDRIRRRADLVAVERLLQRALALQEDQVTAHTRLAALALSRGQYEQALTHAGSAWDAGHRDRVTRLLLSDALIAAGDPEGALGAVRGVAWADGRLVGQAWDRYWRVGDYLRAADTWRVIVGLRPWDDAARRQLAQAEDRIAEQ